MIDYLLLERELEDYFVKALIHLKLPLISINFGEYKFTPDSTVALYNPEKKYIEFNLLYTEDEIYHSCKTEDMNNEDWHIFTLFHEVAHYWHDTWHNKHFKKYRLSHVQPIYMSSEEYNKQNLEKHANNIARILYKRLYKGDIK